MELYLLRHGSAEARSSTGRDPDRRLSPEGQAEVRRLARRIALLGVAPSLILASPYPRAWETAEIVAEILGYQDAILRTACLTPAASPQDVWTELRLHPDAASLLLVGHEPLLSETLAWLLGVTPTARFRPASMARVDLAGLSPVPGATLRFVVDAS